MNIKENIKTLVIKKPLKLDCGKTINNFPLAYETYGSLNKNKDNAILVFHALTGDQFVTGINPVTKKDGWWSYAVGPNKSIDTNKYFVICANVIGGCMGSFGPSHKNPDTNKIYGTDFPVITINDMVNAQVNLLDHFEIKKLFSVVGGSMGGMQVLQFISNYPDKANTVVPIACTSNHSAQNIAFNELGRQAIASDHNWSDGVIQMLCQLFLKPKDQIRFCKRKRDKNRLKGDILFWKGHVGICLNKSRFIHAYGPKKKVIIMPTGQTIKLIDKTANLKIKKVSNISNI